MTAETLVDSLHAAGIQLAVNGDRLHVEAPPGRYNADLRASLIEHKADVVTLIAMRDRLLAIAQTIGVPATIVNRLPASELRACIDQLPLWEGQRDEHGEPLQARVLVFYLRALADMEEDANGSPAWQDAPSQASLA
ncbi:MAG: hypothetical protein ACREPY_09085 [Rhodanobacteraceae bacterium]